MRIRVQLFAGARQRVGREAIDVELPERATVADLKRAIVEQHPALGGFARSMMIALDESFAGDEEPLRESASVALIPPVSGGGRGGP